MIDIHCHILPHVDDGASSLEESIEMLSAAKAAGVTMIISTPHFSRELHEDGEVPAQFRLLKAEAEKYGISLLPGYEIKIRNYPAQMPDDYTGLTLNGSRYILFELPFDTLPDYTAELFYDLQLKKFIPILAHPERCQKLIKRPQQFEEIVETGCLLQVDASSIIGINGRKAKKFAKRIIKKGQVSFIASDAHNAEGYSGWYSKAYKKVQRWIGIEEAGRLFSNTIDSVQIHPADQVISIL